MCKEMQNKQMKTYGARRKASDAVREKHRGWTGQVHSVCLRGPEGRNTHKHSSPGHKDTNLGAITILKEKP